MTQTGKSLLDNTLSIDEYISNGEKQLLKGDFSRGVNSFNKAEQLLDENHPDFYYRMGLALFEFGSEEGHEQVLLLASKKFKQASRIFPESTEILQAWGNTLVLLGEKCEEHHYFLNAKKNYEKALGLGAESADFFWDYAVVWYHFGLHSGEAYDYQKSLLFFERAVDEGESLPIDFWIDYGTAALALSSIIKDPHQTIRAVHCFKHATSIDNSCFDNIFSLAEALNALYDYSHDDDHFSQAMEAYSTAVKLSPQDSQAWLQWAQFLLKSARYSGDTEHLRQSLEKCHHAYVCNGKDPIIMATWAEALALLGQLTERLDLIYEAENKLSEALELEEGDPALWHSVGLCMNSFAYYFNDQEHHYLAIEQFQTGLSLDRTYDPLWHAMANTYTAIGTLEGNVSNFIHAFKFYEKALHLQETSIRHIDYAKSLSKLGELTEKQSWLEQSLYHFEVAFSMQKNGIYLHAEWLFYYATTLDMMGNYHEDEQYYTKAIEVLSHVIIADPDYPGIHHHLAQAYSHLGELTHEINYFYRSIHHLRLALKRDEDNDAMHLDWGIILINLAEHTPIFADVDQLFSDAKSKLTLAAKLGNPVAYYQLSCLFSLTRQYDQALFFLHKAQEYNALPPIDELLCDNWLDNLRATSEFRHFLEKHSHLSEDR